MKGIVKGIGLIVVVLFISSCAARTYVQDKERVDQEMVGNAGCLQGTCPQVDRSDFQKTRRTYVLEVTTGPKNIKAAKSASDDMSSDMSQAEEYPVPAKQTNFAGTRKASTQTVLNQEDASEPSFAEYKIEEGDTLQKISKKFYNTVKLWNKIYEANKDVLSSPDRIRPGKVIRIPQE